MDYFTYSANKSNGIYIRNNGARVITNVVSAWTAIHAVKGSFCFALKHPNMIIYTEFYGFFRQWEYTLMAAKMNGSVEFVNVRLVKDDKKKLAAFTEQIAPDLADHLINFIGSGFKLSINLDAQNDCYIVAATGTQNARVNKGLCMTSRSEDLFEAIYMTLFKHEVLCDNDSWGEPVGNGSNWG